MEIKHKKQDHEATQLSKRLGQEHNKDVKLRGFYDKES